jgi:catechol 2,3-dioxygenase-like lactoylglutathione lyase family enzyme
MLTGMVRLGHVTLWVRDVGVARDWYAHNLGLRDVARREHFVLMGTDDAPRLGLREGEPLADAARVHLHFDVPDVDALYDALRGRGVPFESPPTNKPWGFRIAVLRDPDGHTVELYTP